MDKEQRKAKRETFDQSLRTRVTSAEKDLIEIWADKEARTVSQFLRVAALKYIGALRQQEALPEILEYMRKGGLELGDALKELPLRDREG